MIIRSTRISTGSGPEALIRHIFNGPNNEKIELLHGSAADIRDAHHDANHAGVKFALRHFHIDPAEPLTEEEFAKILAALAKEFGFDVSAATVLQHTKPRADGVSFDMHQHVIVPEYDPVRRRVLSSSWSYARQEKISRWAECEFNHPIVPGRFGASVAKHLWEEGYILESSFVEDNIPSKAPIAAYSSKQKLAAARQGYDIAEARRLLQLGWEQTTNLNDLNFFLAEFNLAVFLGEKSFVLQSKDHVFLGSVPRLLKLSKFIVEERLLKKEIDYVGETSKIMDRQRLARIAGRPIANKRTNNGYEGQAEPQSCGLRSYESSHEFSGSYSTVDATQPGTILESADSRAIAANSGITGENRRKAAQARKQEIWFEHSLSKACENRQTIEPLTALTARLKKLGDKARFKAHREPLGPVRRQQTFQPSRAIQGHSYELSIMPLYRTEAERLERRSRWIAVVASQAYQLGWVDSGSDLVSPVKGIRQTEEGEVIWYLKSGTELVDADEIIIVYGEPDAEAIEQIMRLIELHGWTEIEVSGSPEFQAAIMTRSWSLQEYRKKERIQLHTEKLIPEQSSKNH